MTTHLRSAFVLTSVLSFALAQSPPEPDVERIERSWPDTLGPGPCTDLACGRFVANLAGCSAVVVWGGILVFCFQPALFEHFEPCGLTGVQAIATTEGLGGAPDRLAAITPLGLHVLHFTSAGFVAAHALLASWSDVVDLDTMSVAPEGNPTRVVLGRGPTCVRVATIDATGVVTPQATLNAPVGSQLHDARLFDCVPGGLPEVVALFATGMFILDLAGNVLAAHAVSVPAGKLCVLRGEPTPSVVVVARAGTTGSVATWTPAGVTSGGTFALPQPLTGVSPLDANHDEYQDVIISIDSLVRIVLIGSSAGPQVGPDSPIHVWDVGPPQTPSSSPAPVAVTDIDRDGVADLVAASAKLVVTRRIRTQLQELVFEEPDDGDARKTVSFLTPMGFIFESEPIEALFPLGLQGKDGFGVRLGLPADWKLADSVRAVVYPLADDTTLLQAEGHYLFPLDFTVNVDEGEAAVVDLFIPVPDNTVPPDPYWPGGQRYAIELSLYSAASGRDTAPQLIRFANAPGALTIAEWRDFMESLQAGGSWPIWWFDVLVFALGHWFGGIVPPSAGQPNGNRYLGGVVLVEGASASSRPSADPAPNVHNAVVHP